MAFPRIGSPFIEDGHVTVWGESQRIPLPEYAHGARSPFARYSERHIAPPGPRWYPKWYTWYMTTGAPTALVDARRPQPLWEQTADYLRDTIASGVYPEGSRLPAERELCLELDVSRVTLRKALSALVEEGVLSASHGRGWYVSSSSTPASAPPSGNGDWSNVLESFSETAARMGLVADSVVFEQRIAPASLDEAEELVVAPGTPLLHLGRVRRLDGVPIAVDRTRCAAHLLPRAEELDFSSASLYAELSAAGIEIARAETTIEAREADQSAADRLAMEPGRPILVMRQAAVEASGRPVLLSTIEYSGERYRLRTSFTRSRSPRR
jgi:GntR family transcriptional regulator